MSLPADQDVLLLHNPRCSKSRATHALLTEQRIAFRERRYLDEPLTLEELQELRARLDRAPREWVRRGEAAYADAGLADDATEPELLQALAQHPSLLERPIVVRGAAARVGRPPTAVLELFEED